MEFSEADLKALSLALSPQRSGIQSSAEPEQQQHLLLHQTTQSLLMASSMMQFIDEGAMPPAQIQYSAEDLLRENHALHARVKELSSERDRLLCEVSNLRLELDMSELKRLPVVDMDMEG